MFQFYLITLGIDIAKYWPTSLPLLLVTVLIDLLAMISIAVGVRAVALERPALVVAVVTGLALTSAAHLVTYLFRHPGLNTANLLFASVLTIGAAVYAVLMARFDRLKPADYDIRKLDTTDDDAEEEEKEMKPITPTPAAAAGDQTKPEPVDLAGVEIAGASAALDSGGLAPIANFGHF